MDILFGDVEEAGRIRKMIHFLRYSKQASIRVGEHVRLDEYVREHTQWSDARMGRTLRRLFRVQLAREAMAIHGPPVKPPEKLQFEILERPLLKKELKAFSEKENKPLAEIERQAERYLKEIASTPKHVVQMLIARFLDFLFFRVFNGVEVNEADVARVKEAAKQSKDAPLILIPSHKSHVDYLVLSWVFIRHDFVPPHVAAGANLSFFPLGTLLRNGGAFFLRRSFVGLDLYKMVFKQYVWKLVHEGYPLEFFIEGGRSRTGKLITPKMGILSMVLEGLNRGEYKDLQFVPVNLSYERVVETASYRKELTGGEKESESIKGVLEARKVLRSRYGRVYVHFEAPVRLSDYLKRKGLSSFPTAESSFRVETERLAFHLMHRIQEATVISPSALVGFIALSHERPALSATRLKRLVGFIVRLAEQRGARFSDSIKASLSRAEERINLSDEPESALDPFETRGEALKDLTDEALALLKRLIDKVEKLGQTMYTVPDGQRIELDYYRNGILGLMAPEVIVCAVVASHWRGIRDDRLNVEARWLSDLFKLEFIYRNDVSFEEIIGTILTTLTEVGLIERKGALWRISDQMEEEALTLSSALRHLMECYWVAAHTLKATASSPMEAKAWVKTASEQAELAFLQGEIRRKEAASTVTLANALQWFVRQGWVEETTQTEGRKRTKHYQVRDPEAFEGFFSQLARAIANLPEGPKPHLSPLTLAHAEVQAEEAAQEAAQKAQEALSSTPNEVESAQKESSAKEAPQEAQETQETQD
jgi:glycerol-3-phosphate O-acyltransferase